ncbi:MAG: DUF4974 domain-containing protein, partial [Tannerellaceae bacterium]|nr:DUF4974 domain-containing protein [Tannerellaceae bacterium]
TTTLPGIDIQEIRIEANSGMRTSVNLPDGTLVYLNSGTVITYELPFRKERKIRITGEAFFQVQKDTEKPFIVTSLQGDLDIRVTGTEFNVQAFEEDDIQTVTLVSGSVELGYQSNGSTSVRTLRPAEKAILDTRNGTLEVRSVQVENEIAWKDGRIIFKETPLPEVLKKLSYYYNVKFEVKDDIINSYSFTGTFDNRQLAQVLEYLKISSHINFTIEPPGEDDSNGKKYATVVLWK